MMLYYYLDFYCTLLLIILICFIKFTVCCINEKNTNTICLSLFFVLIGQSHKIVNPFLTNRFWASFCTDKYKLLLLVWKIYKSSHFCTKIYKYLLVFSFQFFIFKLTNVFFLQKIYKLLLFHNIFLLFCKCKRRIRERKKEYMRQIENERKKPTKKRKQLRCRIKIHWKIEEIL